MGQIKGLKDTPGASRVPLDSILIFDISGIAHRPRGSKVTERLVSSERCLDFEIVTAYGHHPRWQQSQCYFQLSYLVFVQQKGTLAT